MKFSAKFFLIKFKKLDEIAKIVNEIKIMDVICAK